MAVMFVTLNQMRAGLVSETQHLLNSANYSDLSSDQLDFADDLSKLSTLEISQIAKENAHVRAELD